jgi:hypothetical protein
MSEEASKTSTLDLSSLWRKFINPSIQGPRLEPARIVIQTRITIAANLDDYHQTPTLKELMDSPLFQIAGMLDIVEPGWADRHDEYLGKTYLDSHDTTESN